MFVGLLLHGRALLFSKVFQQSSFDIVSVAPFLALLFDCLVSFSNSFVVAEKDIVFGALQVSILSEITFHVLSTRKYGIRVLILVVIAAIIRQLHQTERILFEVSKCILHVCELSHLLLTFSLDIELNSVFHPVCRGCVHPHDLGSVVDCLSKAIVRIVTS